MCSENSPCQWWQDLEQEHSERVDCALYDKGVSPREDIYSNTRSAPPGVYKSEEKFITWVGKGALKIILKAVVPLNKKLSALLDKFYMFMEERFIFSSPDEHA